MKELKQEIEEYLTRDYCCEFKKECKDGIRVRCSEYEAKLYLILRFREERIEELEKVCQDLSDKFDYQVKQVMKLEKENAELKAFRQNCVKLTEDNVVMARQRAETSKQLTKAKEIIKDLCGMVRELNKPNVQLTNIDYSLSEAEQFLKEVEK